MSRAAQHRWPSETTIALAEGYYAELLGQLAPIAGTKLLALRMILRAALRNAEETDPGTFEEPRR